MRALNRLLCVIVVVVSLTIQIVGATPVEAQESQPVVLQLFEHGYMLIWPHALGVEVTSSDQALLFFENLDKLGLPDNPILEAAPQGYYKPTGIFGKIWGNVPEVRQRLGWAVEAEEQTTASSLGAAGTSTTTFADGRVAWTQGIGAFSPYYIQLALLNGGTLQTTIGVGWLVTKDGTTIFGPWVRRIRFDPGAYTASVGGFMGSAHGLVEKPSLVLEARAGQHMIVSIQTSNNLGSITSTVTSPDGAITAATVQFPGTIFDGILPTNGDYSINFQCTDECTTADSE